MNQNGIFNCSPWDHKRRCRSTLCCSAPRQGTRRTGSVCRTPAGRTRNRVRRRRRPVHCTAAQRHQHGRGSTPRSAPGARFGWTLWTHANRGLRSCAKHLDSHCCLSAQSGMMNPNAQWHLPFRSHRPCPKSICTRTDQVHSVSAIPYAHSLNMHPSTRAHRTRYPFL